MTDLKIHQARYGIREHGQWVDVRATVELLVKDGSLDIVIDNATLTPNRNLFRGKKKSLWMKYAIDGGEQVEVTRQEKEWLIIGPAVVAESWKKKAAERWNVAEVGQREVIDSPEIKYEVHNSVQPPMTAAALNDYLIRKFHISDRRLRAPMPVELRDFNRNDLAKLFAELGFTRGCEVGVAEGKFSEVLLQANPDMELLLVDPWHHYSDNPQGKSKEKHEFAFNETKRRIQPFWPRAVTIPKLSMDAVGEVKESSLDMVYLDACHSFDFIMSDLIEWSKRVRSGGIVSGDDYYRLSDRWGAGPVEAVQAYINAHKILIWFICDAHKSVDFFWVKP